MPSRPHSQSTAATGNHVQQRWDVANSAAREALTLLSGDVGGVCFQQDQQIFDLLQTVPSVVWQRRATNAELDQVRSGGSLVVLTPSAFATLDDQQLPDGARVRIACYMDEADLIKDSTLDLHPQLVWATLSGTGRWVRRQLPHGRWIRQRTWSIDPVTGTDESGGGLLAPLKTWAELARRLTGTTGRLLPQVPMTIKIPATGLPVDDPILLSVLGNGDNLITVEAALPTPSFQGLVASKVDLSVVAPGTASTVTSSWNPTTELRRLVRDVTNNRWAFVNTDLGGSVGAMAAKLSPWINDPLPTERSVTTGNTTDGAQIETYEIAEVRGRCVVSAEGLTPQSQAVSASATIVFRFIHFSGQASQFIGPGVVFQNCKAASVRFHGGAQDFLNCSHHNGAPFGSGSAPAGYIRLHAGQWTAGFGNNIAPVGCTIDIESNTLFSNAQLILNRGGFLRIRNAFFENIGAAPLIVLKDGAQIFCSSTSVCGQGNTGPFVQLGARCMVQYVGTAASQFKLQTGAVAFTLNSKTTCRAFDDVAGVHTAARALTFANVDLSVAAGGFGTAVLDPSSGAFFGASV